MLTGLIAVPPAPIKQFTDEELKQQYGIHLATRLQAGEGGNESKWADIDDDEDDWVPETVEWIDATKASTLQAADAPAGLPSEVRPISSVVAIMADPHREIALADQQLPAPAPGKTILRPGARAGTIPTKPGLLLKSVPEKPTLLPKPSASSASRSPWAQLPPVEKVSPILFNPPAPQSQARAEGASVFQDALHEDERLQYPGPSPAREIAADDFNRSWQDNSQGHRELYNSQSGKYETVKTTRRSSMRQENGRALAVLQRGSYEAGANRSQDARLGQGRRDSSSFRDRLKLNDNETQTYQGPISTEAQVDASPTTSQLPAAGGIAKEASGQPADPAQTSTTIPVPQQRTLPNADELRVVQERLMREGIEANRKRKVEEQAREEAERQERIKRLALQSAHSLSPVKSKPDSEESRLELPAATESPVNRQPKIDTISSQKESVPAIVTKESQTTKVELSRDTQPSLSTPHPLTSLGQTPPKSLSETDLTAQASGHIARRVESSHRPFPEAPIVGWTNSSRSPDSSSVWAAAQPSATNNVWGSPSNDRILGNGAFTQPLPSIHLPPQQTPPRHTHVPVPFGSLQSSPRAPSDMFPPMYNHNLHSDNGNQTPAEDQHSFGLETPSAGQPAKAPLAPVGEPFARVTQPSDWKAATRAWNLLPTQLMETETDVREKEARDHTLRTAEEARSGVRADLQPIYKETYRRTIAGETFGQRQVVGVMKTVHDGNVRESASISADPAVKGQPHSTTSILLPIASNARSSRFFGPGVDRSQVPPKATMMPYFHDPADPPSPPPPDGVEQLPAFIKAVGYPHVHLPKPHPVVKLPPKVASIVYKAGTIAAPNSTTVYRSGPEPIARSLAWQSRFDGLFDKKPSGQVKPAPERSALTSASQLTLPVREATSKVPLTIEDPSKSTKISLPRTTVYPKSHSMVDQGPSSKPTEDELLDEPREFGSSPTIKLPRAVSAREPHQLQPHRRSSYSTFRTAQFELAPHFFASACRLSFEHIDADRELKNAYLIFITLPGRPSSSKLLHKKNVRQERTRDFRNEHRQDVRGMFVPTKSPFTSSTHVFGEDSARSKDVRSLGASLGQQDVRGNVRASTNNMVGGDNIRHASDEPRTKTQWAKPSKPSRQGVSGFRHRT